MMYHVVDIDNNFISLRARSQIPVFGLTGPTLGWTGALKLPGAAVWQMYRYYTPERQCVMCVTK